MAGAIGGGGLGDLAIRYGYQGFRPDVMIATVVELGLLIQRVQFSGDYLANLMQNPGASSNNASASGVRVIAGAVIAVLLVVVLRAVVPRGHRTTAQTPLRVGVNPVPHGEILQAALPLLKKQELDVQIVYFSDYVQPNLALVSGDLDANYFQHVPFMENFNRSKGTHMVSAGATNVEPLGIYTGRTRRLELVSENALVRNSQRSGKFRTGAVATARSRTDHIANGQGCKSHPDDIASNPHKLRVRELEAAQLPRSLKDADLAVINMNYALAAKLNPLRDALKLEGGSSPDANIVSVMPAHAADPRLRLWCGCYSRQTCSDSSWRSIKAPCFLQQINCRSDE